MGEDALLLLSHQVTLKGHNCVNYATVIKVHCTVGRGRREGELPYETYGYVYCLSWVACAQTPPLLKNVSPNFFFREGASVHRLPYGCKVSADFGLTYGF